LLPFRPAGAGQATDSGEHRYAAFSAALQAAIAQAICAYDRQRPAIYRVAAQLWIDTDGAIERSLLLGSTGDRGRDAAISQLLVTLKVGHARPADLPQPATVIVTPRSFGVTGDCRSVSGPGHTP
jgi:hypothetical protein